MMAPPSQELEPPANPGRFNQLKARLLDTKQVIQVVRETTFETSHDLDVRRRSLQDPASVAWNLACTSFYKSSGTPWRALRPILGVRCRTHSARCRLIASVSQR